MRKTIDTRFADSRAADLSLAYGLRPLPALGTHKVTLGGFTVELRVLGASHQVVLGDWSETVACLPDRPGALPSSEEQVVGDHVVRFAARCGHPADFAEEVSSVIAACEADPDALVVEFPGSPLAVTALSAAVVDGGVAWQTWHAYPQAGELVWTKSVVTPR
ncbi:DUF2617 family protein [Actinophytocola glycyrrhizae]|uniref:DUF2617 family protein n=1 Tax=Actinophytocola glycyrrhizae TaxID=2044873 RepID=A0ABV9S6Q3_9PSEU